MYKEVGGWKGIGWVKGVGWMREGEVGGSELEQ